MKKLLFVLVLLCAVCNAFAQDSSRIVYVINSKPFTGDREEILKLYSKITQPQASNLMLIPMTEQDEDGVREYALYQFSDNAWEFLVNFPGATVPEITYKDGEIIATQNWGPTEHKAYEVVMNESKTLEPRTWSLQEILIGK